MGTRRTLRKILSVALLSTGFCQGALAQSQSAAPVAPSASTVVAATPAPEGCRALTEKAMANDLKAAHAQSRSADLTEQLELLEEAVALWLKTSTQCDGRAKERAQRNLAESQRVRDSITEQLGSGKPCLAAQRDAANLQDMAKKALAERRYGQSATLFRKASDNWDVASELCVGEAQRVAETRRVQSDVDGHNAENCAPLFEAAREQTLKFRAAAGAMAREEKQDASQAVETLWRDVAGRCKGEVVATANGNAQAVARDRGTPWVAKAMVAAPMELNRAAAAQSAGAAGLAAPRPVAAQALANQQVLPLTAALAPTGQNAPASLPPPAPVATDQPKEFTAEGTRYSGKFVIDASGKTYSGTGKITWPNGDMFDGTLVNGRRNGVGQAVWANGQRYNGDWLEDKQTGRAHVRFLNGNQYEGSVLDGKPHGQGRMTYASGDSYAGQFNSGVQDGRGAYLWKSGQKFDGEWKNNLPHGTGRMEFATGEICEGQFAAGEPDGKGTYKWPNGDLYIGDWKAGKKHGQGAFVWKNGDRWEGAYENDQQKTGELTRKPI